MFSVLKYLFSTIKGCHFELFIINNGRKRKPADHERHEVYISGTPEEEASVN